MQCVTPVRLDNSAVVNIKDTVLTFGDARRMAQLCRNSARGMQKSARRPREVLYLKWSLQCVQNERLFQRVAPLLLIYISFSL